MVCVRIVGGIGVIVGVFLLCCSFMGGFRGVRGEGYWVEVVIVVGFGRDKVWRDLRGVCFRRTGDRKFYGSF